MKGFKVEKTKERILSPRERTTHTTFLPLMISKCSSLKNKTKL